MNVEAYLKHRLETCARYTLTDLDKKLLESEGIEAYIFAKLLSKKYRKWSAPVAVQAKIKDVIHFCVASGKPIRFDFSFGGFKLWRMPTAPEVDWSEFFSLAYYAEYAAPIVAAYEPGVVFDFSSGDIAVTAVNNVPREDVERYHESFKTLLSVFEPTLPANMVMGVSRLRDLFADENEYLQKMDSYLEGFRSALKDNPKYLDEIQRGSLQNYQLINGAEDVTNISSEELQRRRTYSYEVAEGMYDMPEISGKNGPDTISLLATKLELPAPSIIIGTTRSTAAKFWAGLGVLAHNGETFAEYVISPKQWEAIKNQPHETIAIDLISLKNFKEVLVYPNKLNFSLSRE